MCAPKKHSSERTRPLCGEETPRQRHKRNVLLPSRRFALVAWLYAVTPSLMCAPGAEKRAVVLTTSSWGRRGEDPSWQMRFPCFHDLPSPLNPASNIGVIYQAVGPFRTRDWSAKTNTTLRSHRRLLPPNGTGGFQGGGGGGAAPSAWGLSCETRSMWGQAALALPGILSSAIFAPTRACHVRGGAGRYSGSNPYFKRTCPLSPRYASARQSEDVVGVPVVSFETSLWPLHFVSRFFDDF